MNLFIETNAGELADQFRELGAGLPRAQVYALNRTAASMRTAAIRLAAQELGVAQKVVRSKMGLTPARRATMTARLFVSGKPLPFVLGRGRSAPPHTFVATMRSGHRGLYERTPGARHTKGRGTWRPRSGWPALPIREVLGPSVASVVRRHVDALVAVVQVAYPKNLAHQVSYLLSKQGGRSTQQNAA